ncbi:CcdC protein domain-containing protein [Phenylobacterium sp.]|uniref:CcdC protein domain-containing protein n=1 Tax=Phenylobacterium sp. TaxID=1871053 RepID=UPI0025E0E762|nr:CcdC protein domain-containing protein [Phenylobacterium sp.]
MATLVPVAIVMVLVILRNSRARRLRIEAMWVAPVIIVAMIGLALFQETRVSVANGGPSISPLSISLDLAAVLVGALLGWWRARFTHITIDPVTHELTSRASPIGMVVILGILVLRMALRTYVTQGALGEWGPPVADALLVLSVGLVCAQRLEIFLRANRLLQEARGNAGL